MKAFTKKYHPPGTAPGVLASHNDDINTGIATLWRYNATTIFEQACARLTSPSDNGQDLISWLDITNMNDPESIRHLGKTHNIHSLALEDVLNKGQRPKIDYLDNHLFIVLSLPGLKDQEITLEQISLFVNQEQIISFCQGDGHIFEPVRERLRQHSGRLRNNDAGYLLYALVDAVIDAAFPVLEALSDTIETLEEDIISAPEQSQLHTLHWLKRDLLLLRKRLWPQRDILHHLVRAETALMSNEHRIYFSDCYDHTIQAIELIETYREILTGLMDLYLSGLNIRMNNIMRVLTITATIFIPLTFLVGVYGMNFRHMPELEWFYGYPILWGIMVAVVIGMLWLFRRNHWL